jgi:hypothetical protein
MKDEFHNEKAYRAAEVLDKLDIVLRTLDTKKDKTKYVVTTLFRKLEKELQFALTDCDDVDTSKLPRSPMYKDEYVFYDTETNTRYASINDVKEMGDPSYREVVGNGKDRSERWIKRKEQISWFD